MADGNLPAEVEKGELVEVKPPKTLNEIFTSDYVVAAIQNAAPKHLKAERFLRIANTAMTRTPQLKDCTLASVWDCLMELSSLGLEPDGRRAHLIPYGTKCTLLVDYKGIVECVRRSGEVSDIHAEIVCENDEFEYDKGKVTIHRINFRKPRGEMFAVYDYVKFKDGTESYDVMGKEDVDKIRERSKAGTSGPWVTDYNEMAKKTVFRRHSKWLPFSPEVHNVIEADDRFLFPDIARDSITEGDIRGMSNGARMSIKAPEPIDAETDDAPPVSVDTPPSESTSEPVGKTKQAELKDMILQMCGDDEAEAKQYLAVISGFKSTKGKNKGEMVPGVQTVEELTEKRLEVVFDKVKKEFDEGQAPGGGK